MIPRSRIPKTDLSVSRIGLGTCTFGREIDEAQSHRVLDYALERGINLLDNAEAYGSNNVGCDGGQNESAFDRAGASSERILGRWLKERGCRRDVVILTKCSSGGDPENIQRALTRSLERLMTDRVDIYMVHKPDPGVPLAETLGALSLEVDRGRVRTIGLSNYSAEQTREALAIAQRRQFHRVRSVQPPYSLALPDADTDLLPLCRREGIAAITYSPLAAGFLTGKYRPDGRIPPGTRFDIKPGHQRIYFSEHNFKIVARLEQRAKQQGRPMIQLAMAWVLGSPDVSSMLIGVRNTSHIDNALQAMELALDEPTRRSMRHAREHADVAVTNQ